MTLNHTSERVVEDFLGKSLEDYFIYQFHIATYKYARKFVANKKVLDFGCGSGYGTSYIADYCKEIVGVDISDEAISYANSNYKSPNLSFTCIETIELLPLPFMDKEFDVVISFQVIEHIEDTDNYLKQIHRVLKPGGQLIIVTPDRSTRLFSFQKPWNMWHVKEYTRESLAEVVSPYFREKENLKMGGPDWVLKSEINRTTKMKWATLPFTLPFVSESVRRRGLMLLKQLKKKRMNRVQMKKTDFNFDDSVFEIRKEVDKSINLIIICTKDQEKDQ